jgi:hypothetical protein
MKAVRQEALSDGDYMKIDEIDENLSENGA